MSPGVESHRELIPDAHQERLTGSGGWSTDEWEGAGEGPIPPRGGVRLWVSMGSVSLTGIRRSPASLLMGTGEVALPPGCLGLDAAT